MMRLAVNGFRRRRKSNQTDGGGDIISHVVVRASAASCFDAAGPHPGPDGTAPLPPPPEDNHRGHLPPVRVTVKL